MLRRPLLPCAVLMTASLACRADSSLAYAIEAAPPADPAAVETDSADPGDTATLLAPFDHPGQGGLVYELYVRSFQDSDGDGTGDFNGVTSRLDYLGSVGVETLWLMPVFPAFGPAGYDVTDFTQLRDDYGTASDLQALVEAAHARGMRVILDLPLNHVHATHPWFVDLDAHPERFVLGGAPDEDAPGAAARWFPTPSDPDRYYYAYFGADMPDLAWQDAGTRAELVEAFRAWLDAGLDGYRLDAVLMLVEEDGVVEGSDASHALVADLRRELEIDARGGFLLAEASEWEPDHTAGWLGDADEPEADAVLDFPRREALVAPDAAEVADILATEGADAAAMAVFLDSHDTDRLATSVTDPAARRALRVAQLLLPGLPVLYYGDEIDQANATTGTGQDLAMRAPMAWDGSNEGGFTTGHAWFPADPAFATVNVTEQLADPASMLNLVVSLAKLRAAAGPGGGAVKVVDATVLEFTRGAGEAEITVQVNLGEGEAPTAGLGPWGYRVTGADGVLLAS